MDIIRQAPSLPQSTCADPSTAVEIDRGIDVLQNNKSKEGPVTPLPPPISSSWLFESSSVKNDDVIPSWLKSSEPKSE